MECANEQHFGMDKSQNTLPLGISNFLSFDGHVMGAKTGHSFLFANQIWPPVFIYYDKCLLHLGHEWQGSLVHSCNNTTYLVSF